jgi:sugar lactone lactonase YvrE
MRAEQITGPVAHHAEGPVWWPGWGGLRWVDMLAGEVLTLASNGTVDRFPVGDVAAAIRPRRDGGMVIGVERGFALQHSNGTITTLKELWTDDSVRMNEGGCDPDGRFYCGSMAYDKRPGAASLYRLDPDGSVEVVLRDVTISNGLEWSADGALAYYNDTETLRTDVFDYDFDSGLTNRRTFAEMRGGGRPDGLTVDSEGGVWIALSNQQAVHRYSPDGVLDEVIDVPVRKVTACTFGGPELDELFITTTREGLEPDSSDSVAGSLFRAHVGIRGIPARTFGG